MSKLKPTMFDTGDREVLPAIDPDKRAGGGEYTTPSPNNQELVEDSGILSKGLNAVGIKTIKQEKKAIEERKASSLTKPNVPPMATDTAPYHQRFSSVEDNPILNNVNSNDVRNIIVDGDNVGFDSKKAMETVTRSMGISGDLNNLSDKDVGDLAKIAENFSKVAGYNQAADYFGTMVRVNDGVVKYTKAGNNATGVMGLLSVISGESGVWEETDVGAHAAFIHALTNKAIEWHIPEYIDKLTGMVYNNELKQMSLEYNLVFAAQQSNLVAFKELYKHLDNNRKIKIRDNLLRTLISYYRHVDGVNRTSLLLECMYMVHSHWDIDPDDLSTPYVYYYSFSSNDALDGLTKTDKWKLALAGRAARAKSSEEIINMTIPSFNYSR